MENKSALTKFSTALAVLCAVICIVSIAPLVAVVIFALVSLICLLCCLIILLIGAFVWLVTAGQTNIFEYATALSNFGLGLFNYITPIANFSIHYLSPIAGGIALFIGIVGIIVSAVGISKANRQKALIESQSSSPAAAEVFVSTDLTQETNSSKKRGKRKKTSKGACVSSLVVCCVFSAVAILVIIISLVAVTMF